MSDLIVSGLYVHPVKSFKVVSVDKAYVDLMGFQFDRRFMLVEESGKFITQRKYPVLANLSAQFDGDELIISGGELFPASIRFKVSEFSKQKSVSVWDDEVSAFVLRDERTKVISDVINREVALAYMPKSSFRQVDRTFFSGDQSVSFADGFPFLLANEASLSDLNGRLANSVGMSRFRPNIVFKGDIPFQEDGWKRVLIGEVEFAVVKPCSRCVMTCVDDKGVKHKEPLATLSTYRKNEFGVCFGQNMVQLNIGTISVGDKITVLE